MKLSLEEVRNAFDPGVYGRGAAYRRDGRVMESYVRPDGNIHGVVEGSERQYSQSIWLNTGRKGITIRGKCSCPIGENCKHVAAILIELAYRGEEISAGAQSFEASLTREQREWLSELDSNLLGCEKVGRVPTNQPRLIYLVDLSERPEQAKSVRVRAVTARPTDDGKLVQGPFRMPHFFSGTWPKYVPDADRLLLSLLSKNFLPGSTTEGSFQLSGPLGDFFFRQIIESERAHWFEVEAPVLTLSDSRDGIAEWHIANDGSQKFNIRVEGGGTLLPLWNPWWIDHANATCGPISLKSDEKLVRALLSAPAVHPEQSNAFAEELRKRIPLREELIPDAKFDSIDQTIQPVPTLRLSSIEAPPYRAASVNGSGTWIVATLHFQYGTEAVHWTDSRPVLTKLQGKTIVRTPRTSVYEQECVKRLTSAGWGPVASIRREYRFSAKVADDMVMFANGQRAASAASMDTILAFIYHQVPQLKSDGWVVIVEPEVNAPISGVGTPWDIKIDDIDSNWFNLNLGIEVDGEQIDLMPVLLKMTSSLYRSHLRTITDDQLVFGHLEDGRRIALPASRVKPLVETLFELYDYDPPTSGSKKLARWRAAELSKLESDLQHTGAKWEGAPKLRELGARLSTGDAIKAVDPPSGFRGELRQYQKEGVGWIQFLCECGFSGVLADDMGLGKTVQTLAHLLVEQQAGRLTAPCLIVAPTSLMTNWRLEAEKFAPTLKVLTIHGPDRKPLFSEIPQSDLVLTTYALLARDMPELEKHRYHLVLLDEAQNIKNPKTNAAKAARGLQANQKLCLTGTPMENHLGELWSIFDFLLPGFLGSEQQFQKNYRLPIEKSGNDERRRSLVRRVRPFMLRRTKEEVVKELPPKTEIIEHIELHGTQRDLYESIRLAMHSRVRDAVQRQGVSKSHIVILDALLKLRQVCCDPRLLKLEAAANVEESAKFERLFEMIPEMLDEGRKILLFSQFTSMLALIEPELQNRKIQFAKLTGETVDRGHQVELFQGGKVPVFLLSLKAGGTGLNLTAADTVIHYDPWWNPAVERQASDRAHRIGQEKPVFVYKLCTLGTVEEKIQDLQLKKQQLADSLFDESANSTLSLSEDDLNWIFGK